MAPEVGTRIRAAQSERENSHLCSLPVFNVCVEEDDTSRTVTTGKKWEETKRTPRNGGCCGTSWCMPAVPESDREKRIVTLRLVWAV